MNDSNGNYIRLGDAVTIVSKCFVTGRILGTASGKIVGASHFGDETWVDVEHIDGDVVDYRPTELVLARD